ncbi:radical SAM protein [Ignicoccus hospitalis]|uniref:Radical SAM domain protein n=1 Tax=Ignicoccus hospitalis (strain KIN4/I / DSM 18386 / JCM 14125) TaxID=453591 RepID=A8A9C1_IGNH4|nr:radical SAM protein [Ignicoccus hospitalis]ABU81523.1 Radical SAM domain protein [Ignicoccus hospitalis KIN4/I]HIH90458.1 radical SAM protein [Desulfurococcaceae archaeon]
MVALWRAFSALAELSRRWSEAWLRKLLSSPGTPMRPEGRVSLYLHVPFCRSLCKFCHFVRFPYSEDLASKYFKKLIKDVEEAHSSGVEAVEVYVGGGSPSSKPEALGELVDLVWSLWRPQISVEVHPVDVAFLGAAEHLDPKKVTRVSMGVQSFSPEGLKKLGRPVSPETNELAIEILKSKKFKTFNVDVVWGLEDPTPDAVKALECGADQVTFYPLMPFPKRGPEGERLCFQNYQRIVREASKRGFVRQNAWTFSKTEAMVDEYVARAEEFLGLGVSSFSLVGGAAHLNVFDLEEYFKRGWSEPWHSVKLNPLEGLAFKVAMALHSSPPLRAEALWYSGLVALRELYGVLGEFRLSVVSKLWEKYAPKPSRGSASLPARGQRA